MPATIPNTLVVFASFFLGHGRRHAFQGVPEDFAANVQGVGLPITQTGWISFVKSIAYIAKNDTRNQLFHSTHFPQEFISQVRTNPGVSFITIDSEDNYFIKHNNGWNARLPPKQLNNIRELKPHIPNFDDARGNYHGQTPIFYFAGGFMAELNEETQNNAKHPLTKVMAEFDEGWCIEPGSTLCPYSDRYFFLNSRSQTTMSSRRDGPYPTLSQKLAELQQLTESPEDQTFLNQLRMVETQKQQADIASAMEGLRAQAQLPQMAIRGSRAANMLAGDYVEVRRYY
ncbi:hypothetical protein MVEN_02252700 [Mycena venus]|uniref:Uncharacterized protein n=1 Tax=Mycena venus TaxID=2733690 RepID=A0A8H6X5S1_9AGAR|nr:hypothetical protein MVEN_02252700 [Mycena venus]